MELEWTIKFSLAGDLETKKWVMEKKPDLHGSGNDFSRQKEDQRQKFSWKQVGKAGDRKKAMYLRGKG